MARRELDKPDVAVMTETAGRQKHIQAFAHLPNINPIPVLKCDAEGRVLFLNFAAESFLLSLGLSREDATRILPPHYRQQIRTILEKKSGPLASLHEYEDRSLAVTFSADPDRPECMVLVEDVTDQRRAEERLRRYAAELESMNYELRKTQAVMVQSEKMASQGSLMAGVAHEINSPVGVIDSNSQLMVQAMDKLLELLETAPAEFRKNDELRRVLQVLEGISKLNQIASNRIVDVFRSLHNFTRLDEAESKEANVLEGLELNQILMNMLVNTPVHFRTSDLDQRKEIMDMPSESNYVTLTEQNFRKEVLESSKPVLLDFWASWCGPCQMIAPVIEQLAADFEGKATVAKLNVDEEPRLASQFGIRSIPSILFFQDGKIVHQVVGAVLKDTLATKLEALLPAA